MPVSRLRDIPGIGVDVVGDAADALHDPDILRLENLDTDVRPPAAALAATREAVDDDSANSYLPFQGRRSLLEAVASHVGRIAGRTYDPVTQCVSVAGGLNGILNALLATVEPGQEVVLCDPVYAGLVNRVRLAGGVTRFVPTVPTGKGWTVDPEQLAAAVGPNTAAVLMMGPLMPTGLVLDDSHWTALAEACERHDAWLIYDAAMERIRFDGRPPSHPARLDALAERTITVGAASKELRMIGWRVGWVVGPADILNDIRLVGLTNVVCQVGIAQEAVAAALSAPDADADMAAATAEWQRRCEAILHELADFPLVRPHGGWSLLLDTAELGLTPAELSDRLLTHGKVAATPMNGWGPSGDRYLRFVFANEPVDRLTGLGHRFREALSH
ncbi:pyridoxal phosphate-dependent aminotransferase [Actinomadura barringtoniae]|uniref:Pyridoxal phosphate-dependent aminotransferase n=1 Tax=Actinomadura barringtoniae TaxID=1427535 RepID=A0A939PL76_9ACTN|nr:pyridoxal phosphate-dependent aminotransferase [Actinomadura barringtoniae]MBO2451934.1 pyridoxal phosphate-dependent aminotransferase [Actinomadura barringtoniae]